MSTMKIGILSDIHDNIGQLDAALRRFQGLDQLWCLGDLCSPFIMDRLGRGFAGPIHVVFGNNDGDRFRLTLKAGAYSQIQLHGEFARLEVSGKRIALHHFDDVGRELARGGQFDVVCFGHNHRYEMTRVESTLVLNPGEILGGLSEPPVSTCMILELPSEKLERIDLANPKSEIRDETRNSK